MPSSLSEITHSQILMWVVGFFFTGIGAYSFFFWYITKGLKVMVRDVASDVHSARSEIAEIDKRKVELVVYLDDKDKAEQIVKTLQTTDRCMLMQRACIGSITPTLTDIKDDLKTVLKNQEEFVGVKSVLELVTNRQQEVIKRIDSHINGHNHKE